MRKKLIIGALLVATTIVATTIIKVKNFTDALSISLQNFQKPSFNQGIASFPLSVVFTNPTALTMPVKNLLISLYTLKIGTNQWVLAGESNYTQSFNIIPGTSSITVNPQLQLKALNPIDGDSIEDKFNQLVQVITSGVTYKVVIQSRINGVRIKKETEFNV